MSFISSTYLIGEINIPNKTGSNSDATAIAQYITRYEKEILISLLGYELYSLLIADCTDFVPVSQIYKDLVNGVEFTHTFNGVDYLLKWNGLQNTDLVSLIAYYVFYKWQEYETVHNSSSGSLLIESEGGQRVSPMNEMINAWDKMRLLYGKLPVELKKYVGSNPIPADNISCVYDCEPSAFNFLYANKANYPTWTFKPIWGINQFGI